MADRRASLDLQSRGDSPWRMPRGCEPSLHQRRPLFLNYLVLLAAQIVKKLFLVGFVALIEPGKTVQLIFGFAFCLVYLLFASVIVPFVADDDDFFCTLCNFVLTASVFLCVVLKQATLAEALDTYMSEEMRETYWFDSALVQTG